MVACVEAPCEYRKNASRNSSASELKLGSMGQPQFVHLHVHTDYSLLDGACETSELLDEASRQKMPAVAVTDHGNLFAAANFFHEASKRDVKPIIGCEVYVAKGSRHDRGEKTNGAGAQERGEVEMGTRGSNHLVLLCESLEGYQNLIKLVSAGFLEGFYYKPRIDYDLLARRGDGSGGRRKVRPGARERLPAARRLRQRKFLSRNSGSGTGNRARRESRTRPALERNRYSARCDERLPLPAQCRRARAGSAPVHSNRQDHERRAPHEIRHGPVLLQDRRGDGGRV